MSKPIGHTTLLNSLRLMGYTKEEHSTHGFRSIASTFLIENEIVLYIFFRWLFTQKEVESLNKEAEIIDYHMKIHTQVQIGSQDNAYLKYVK